MDFFQFQPSRIHVRYHLLTFTIGKYAIHGSYGNKSIHLSIFSKNGSPKPFPSPVTFDVLFFLFEEFRHLSWTTIRKHSFLMDKASLMSCCPASKVNGSGHFFVVRLGEVANFGSNMSFQQKDPFWTRDPYIPGSYRYVKFLLFGRFFG